MNLKCRQHACTFVSDSLLSSLITAGLHPDPRNFKEFAVEMFTVYRNVHFTKPERIASGETGSVFITFYTFFPVSTLNFSTGQVCQCSVYILRRGKTFRGGSRNFGSCQCGILCQFGQFFWQYQRNLCSPPGSFIRFGCLQLCLHSKNKNQGEVLTDRSTSTANRSSTSATRQNWSSSEKSKIAEVDVGQL